jgi:hypothetical protein
MLNKIKFLILLILSSILFSNCSSVKEALDPSNKNTSEEFLVEKKSPLSMPPSFEELPIPSNQKRTEENQTNNIKLLITNNKISDEKLENVEVDKDFEQSILDKIKNN